MEKIEKIYEEMQDDYKSVKNRIFLGLEILNKYTDELQISPAHDEIYAGLKEEEYEKMEDDDIRKMFEMGWGWEYESFRIFT